MARLGTSLAALTLALAANSAFATASCNGNQNCGNTPAAGSSANSGATANGTGTANAGSTANGTGVANAAGGNGTGTGVAHAAGGNGTGTGVAHAAGGTGVGTAQANGTVVAGQETRVGVGQQVGQQTGVVTTVGGARSGDSAAAARSGDSISGARSGDSVSRSGDSISRTGDSTSGATANGSPVTITDNSTSTMRVTSPVNVGTTAGAHLVPPAVVQLCQEFQAKDNGGVVVGLGLSNGASFGINVKGEATSSVKPIMECVRETMAKLATGQETLANIEQQTRTTVAEEQSRGQVGVAIVNSGDRAGRAAVTQHYFGTGVAGAQADKGYIALMQNPAFAPPPPPAPPAPPAAAPAPAPRAAARARAVAPAPAPKPAPAFNVTADQVQITGTPDAIKRTLNGQGLCATTCPPAAAPAVAPASAAKASAPAASAARP